MRTKWLSLFVLLVPCIGGCVHKELLALNDFQPVVRSVEAPDVAVALRVDDARPQRLEGDPAYIGVIHEAFGETYEFRLSDAAAIQYLVRVATRDALRLARVGVSPQAPRLLIATIRKFWVAVPSREAHVIVAFTLEDRDGEALWSGSAAGGSGGWIWTQSNLRGVYQRSLSDYAEAASKAFASRDFQRQLY